MSNVGDVPAVSLTIESAIIVFRNPFDPRFPDSRIDCPDAGQTGSEQQLLLRFPKQLRQTKYCNLMAPGLLSDTWIHTSNFVGLKELFEF
jgi:hypothetical protein